MRTRARMVAAAIGMLIACPAAAVELSSTWKVDETRRYQYEETANAGGVSIALRSTFVERARALRRDGGVDLDITIEALQVCHGQPERCESPALGSGLRTVHAVSDRKSRIVAAGVPTVTLHDGRILVHPGAPPAQSRDAALDVVPLRLLELLALPDGAVAKGAPVDSQRATGTVRWMLRAIDHDLARVRITMDARPRLSADLAARFAVIGGALVEARGVLIGWQPVKRNAVVLLERR